MALAWFVSVVFLLGPNPGANALISSRFQANPSAKWGLSSQQQGYKSILKPKHVGEALKTRRTTLSLRSFSSSKHNNPLGFSSSKAGSLFSLAPSSRQEKSSGLDPSRSRRSIRRIRKWIVASCLLAVALFLVSVRGAAAAAAASTLQNAAAPPLTAAAAAPPSELLLFRSPVSKQMEFCLIFRLLAAAAIGAAVGKERSDTNHHSAGVRTMALVALGASAFTICSLFGFSGVPGTRYDPSRMASNVASGVGFIGAGVITTSAAHHSHNNNNNNNNHGPGNSSSISSISSNHAEGSVVRGLTTAAAIWLSASVGVACGVGLYFLSAAAGLMTITILRFGRLTKREKFEQRREKIRKHLEKLRIEQEREMDEKLRQGVEEHLRQQKTLQQKWTNETDSLNP